MGDFVRVKLEGADELTRILDGMEDEVRKKVLKTAVTKAARPVLKAIKAGVPVEHGALKKALSSKVKVYPKSGTVVAFIGARSDVTATITDQYGNSKVVKPSKYLHLVEYGATAHDISRKDGVSVHHPGMAGSRFMLKGFNASKGQALAKLETAIREGIEKAASGK